VARFGSRLILVGLTLGGLALANVARAQSAVPPDASAHEHALQLFSDGKKAYKQGDMQTAIKDLEAAYELEPAPVLLYNLARAYEGIGELEKAVSAYEHFLSAEPNAEDRGAIETRLATLKREIDEQAQKQAPSPPSEVAPEVPAAARSPSTAPFFVLAGGGAGLVLGGIFGGLALGENHTQNASTTSQLDAQSAHDRASSFAVASDIGFIAGGALVAAGVVWLIVDRTQTKAPSRSGAWAPLVVRF
jgi:tetratricopeptide (TPR) repeat protein